jgi:hypothetical protein
MENAQEWKRPGIRALLPCVVGVYEWKMIKSGNAHDYRRYSHGSWAFKNEKCSRVETPMTISVTPIIRGRSRMKNAQE